MHDLFASRTFLGHTGGVWCIQQKGDLLVSGSVDKTVRWLFLEFSLVTVGVKEHLEVPLMDMINYNV